MTRRAGIDLLASDGYFPEVAGEPLSLEFYDFGVEKY